MIHNPQGVCYLGGMQAKHGEMQQEFSWMRTQDSWEKQEVSRPVLVSQGSLYSGSDL